MGIQELEGKHMVVIFSTFVKTAKDFDLAYTKIYNNQSINLDYSDLTNFAKG